MSLHRQRNKFSRLLFSLLAGISLLIIPSSCQKSPINGDLDGQWQVMDVTPEPEFKPIKERIYYCFGLHVCQLTYYGNGFMSGNMKYNGSTIYIDFPYAIDSMSNVKLKQYGINENPVTFTVEHLDKKSLIIKNGNTTVTMRRF